MKSIQVGNTVLDISKFEAGDGKGTHIDSGTTLAYLPGPIFDPVRQLILTSQPNLSIQLVEDFYECFHFNKSIDESFPTVTFGFENSLELNVYPHDYLLPVENQSYCLRWQDNQKWNSDLIVLGDLVLANKLVLYDLENQVLGLSTALQPLD
ncbi:aspartic proteinase-like protein 2 [Papaver somniferum]|uniref:aspartic proteinase-like protein 2 n=1 Tax=Papaver somniferum TaxID=3469 RepID=UPI000E6F5710|nr:aspartic proteinase-like protein 2 [Papaver somniferum]